MHDPSGNLVNTGGVNLVGSLEKNIRSHSKNSGKTLGQTGDFDKS